MSGKPRTRLGVLGWPVAHSRSPAMQNAALREVGLSDWRYQLLPVAPELFAETVAALAAAGFRGVNVTIPHKQAALALATSASERARAIGAANTLLFEEGGEIVADNTDAPALIEVVPFPLAGRSALVLGAGGTARAAVWALLDAGAAGVSVWNRSAQRAVALCAELGATPVSSPIAADLLVNCTSVGLHGDATFKDIGLAADSIAKYKFVVDYVYGSEPTELVIATRAASVPVIDGLELLVGQGALSFSAFTGHAAPRRAMRAAVRET